MSSIEEYTVPVPMLVGAGALRRLPELLERHGATRPFIVTDPGVRRAGIVDTVLEVLEDASSEPFVFDAVSSNPREEDVLEAVDRWRDHVGDAIVALGGGSAIDAAKGLTLLSSHEGTITDYDFLRGGAAKIVRPTPPLIAVPTTAGTGSEVSRGALVITRRGDVVRKTFIGGPPLVPRAVILDAELTLSLPPALTAATGMDALSHAVEEISSPRPHPVIEAIALSTLERLARDLPRVQSLPDDLEARGAMLVSAMMGGIGFEKGLGAVHSLSHAIGALHDVHHGMLNAALLPPVIELNAGHFVEGVPSRMAATAGLRSRDDTDSVRRLAERLRELSSELALPARLRDLGVPETSRDEVIARALEDHCHRTNPRPCGPDEMQELWERSW